MFTKKVSWNEAPVIDIEIEDMPDWICLCDVKGIYWEPRLFVDYRGLKGGLKRLEGLL